MAFLRSGIYVLFEKKNIKKKKKVPVEALGYKNGEVLAVVLTILLYRFRVRIGCS